MTDDWRYFLALAFAFWSFPLWIVGLSAFAQSKGYGKWMGVLGFTSFVGWLIVKALPDRWERLPKSESD